MYKFKLVKRKSFQHISPVPHLLGTNNIPTEEELVIILGAIATARKHEEDLVKKLTIITKRWVKPKLDVTRKFLQSHLALTSAIRRFPVELLQTIFVFWAEDYMPHPRFMHIRISHLPWTLSHVCKLWRNIALITPQLWRRMPQITLHKPFTRSAPFLNCLEELLERSEGSDIDISIHTTSLDHGAGLFEVPYYAGGGHPCLELLLKHSDRWSCLFLLFKGTKILEELAPIKGHLSSLRHLDISEIRVHEPQSAPYAINLFENALNLERLKYGAERDIILPGARLDTLEGTARGNINIHRLVEITKSMSETLTQLNLQFYNKSAHPPIGTLPKLVKLDLFFRHNDETSTMWFLDGITAPVLELFSIIPVVEPGRGQRILSSVYNMIKRSGMTTLHSLRLDTSQQHEGLLSDILMLTYQLRHLDITLPHHRDLQRLADSDEKLVPFLETCFITVPYERNHSVVNNLADALKKLGSNRAKFMNLLHPRDDELPPSQLHSLSIRSRQSNLIKQYQCTLHGWTETAESLQLSQLRRVLNNIFYGEDQGGISQSRMLYPAVPKLFPKEFTTVKEALHAVENVQVNHASVIVVSGLHSTLAHISHVYKPYSNHALGIIATRILMKWLPLFRECRRTVQWATVHVHSGVELEYVSDGCGLKRNRSQGCGDCGNCGLDYILQNEWCQSDDFSPFL